MNRLKGRSNIHVIADSAAWLGVLAGERNLLWALLTRRMRLRGNPKWLLAFGVELKWCEQFAGVLAAARQGAAGYFPGWYSGQSWTGRDLSSMTSSMSSSLSSAIASASPPPGSSSGFDGGSSGGGSSGGGGGGGGGGGW